MHSPLRYNQRLLSMNLPLKPVCYSEIYLCNAGAIILQSTPTEALQKIHDCIGILFA